jgi:uncharacterized membrane protein
VKETIVRGWTRWAAWGLAVLFVAAIFALSVLKHDSFHTRALDLAKFDQAIWNTLHGRFLFSTMENQSILANHFSPLMALLSPLFLIWNDIRMLFLAQAIGLAVAGLFLHRIVQTKHPQLATWFLLAFYLNPALHEVALVEVRRVTMAVPFLALALYALYTRRRVCMVVGLFLALLCKENVGLLVFMVGLYLILFERDLKWGLPVALVGLAWAVMVMLWVVPAIAQQPGEAKELYPQLRVFCLEGESYGQIVVSVLREPQMLLGRMVDKSALQALWRIFLPVGLVLPFLASDWLIIILPSMAYMLMSCLPYMHGLESWYSASILPGLFAAVGVALTRLERKKARGATAWLLFTTLLGYALFSHAPLGARYEPALYQINDHHRLASQVVDAVPKDARVAVQDAYVPHLTHREQIYLFPWISTGLKKIDYFLLDRQLHPYPLQPDELNDVIDEMISNTSLVIELEGDGIYLFHQGGEAQPSFPVSAVAGETMLLERVEAAVLRESGFFQTVSEEPLTVRPGQTLRVSLYWRALDAPGAKRTVSVRIVDAAGALAVQSDNVPGQGKKPTSDWGTGLEIRDVHYLTVSPSFQPGPGSLDVVVYDSFTAEPVPTDSGAQSIHLFEVELIP